MSYLARAVCISAHQAVGQRRKYGGLDYYTHPIAVADLLLDYGLYNNMQTDISLFLSGCMVEAAHLHDVIEDTEMKYDDLKVLGFHRITIELVNDLTDPAKDPAIGNREFRNAINLEHTKNISSEAKCVKCCDIMHNASTLLEHADTEFSKLYINEKIKIAEEALKPDETSKTFHKKLYPFLIKQLYSIKEKIDML